MSQAVTFYQVSPEVFNQLEASENRSSLNISSIAKDYSSVQGSFMAIEYILSKGQSQSVKELVGEIFNPTKSIGGYNLDSLTPDEQLAFFENGGIIYYLNQGTVTSINQLLDAITDSTLHDNYNSSELNANRIYPEVWHDDNSPDQAYNERHLIDDTTMLKNLFRKAAKDKDYVLVFGG